MNFIPYLFLGYGLLLFIGGFIGYHQTGSMASAITGLTAEILCVIGGIGMLKRIPYADLFSLVLSALFTAFFAYRFAMTHKVMPGLIFAIISLAMTVALYYYRGKKITNVTKG